MRLFFATDIHGSEKCFRKFLNAGIVYEADAVILGGDLTGKVIVPILPLDDGTYRITIQDAAAVHERIVRNKDELDDIIKGLRVNGFYPYETDSRELEEMKSIPEKLEATFHKVIAEDIRRWLQLAEERLKSKSIKCYISGGNDDPIFIADLLSKSDVICDPEGEVVSLDESHEMITCGFSNPTPWNAPRELSEEQLALYIGKMASQIENYETAVFNIHVPPYDSEIDAAPKLDTSAFPPTPIMSAGRPVMAPAGSKAVRASLEKYAPLLGMFGHIHESKGYTKVGRTLCFNPGSEYSEGILDGYLLNIDGTRVRYQLISG